MHPTEETVHAKAASAQKNLPFKLGLERLAAPLRSEEPQTRGDTAQPWRTGTT